MTASTIAPGAAPTLADYARFTAMREKGEDRPAISVVTVTFNAAATLERAIESLHAQSFRDYEHIVVDAGSTDGTVDIVRRMLRPQDFSVSERDRGISDGFNRGVALARGRAVLFLNADDWLSPDQLERAWIRLQASGADFVFGDLVFYEGGAPSFFYRGEPDYRPIMASKMPALNHPTVLTWRANFERIGLFDLGYRCAMDYDWFLRLHLAGGRGVHDPLIIGHMTHDGVSNTQFRRTMDEVRRIAIAHGRPAWRANLEAAFRTAKTTASHLVKKWARPLYQLVRQVTNRSYEPMSRDSMPGRAGDSRTV